jgi:hypothetical protein
MVEECTDLRSPVARAEQSELQSQVLLALAVSSGLSNIQDSSSDSMLRHRQRAPLARPQKS